MPDFRALWDQGLPIDRFVATSAIEYRDMWKTMHRIARVPDWAVTGLPEDSVRRLLVLAEDWCSDGSSTVPVLARWTEAVPGLELRILRRDEHLDLMGDYLTNGALSIPIVIVLDEEFNQLGHWGPRPAPLQAWVKANREMPKPERTREIRRWYAKDRGETAIREVAALLDLPAKVA